MIPGDSSTATPAQPSYDPLLAQAGKDLWIEILGRYQSVDKFYGTPDLWGAMEPDPLAVICMPEDAYENLDDEDRKLIANYMASVVPLVKDRPLSYSRIPAGSPVAGVIRQNARTMTHRSWAVIVGPLINEGRDILSERIVRSSEFTPTVASE